ncbi:MAG: SMP-30/gluconolactonase/LRE family protein, partial [Pseudomonadota bacterium]
MTDIYDPHRCLLGEGPLWHPERQELFWFDILAKELRTAERVPVDPARRGDVVGKLPGSLSG